MRFINILKKEALMCPMCGDATIKVISKSAFVPSIHQCLDEECKCSGRGFLLFGEKNPLKVYDCGVRGD